MSVLWGERRRGRAAHALSEIEVDEVSLVDRPATGKRFVLFKRRGGACRPPEEDTNIRSCEAEGPDDAEGGIVAVEALEKRAEETRGELERLRTVADGLERRLAAIEKVRPARQSAEPAPAAPRLWSGIL